jgi:hypothetical protein
MSRVKRMLEDRWAELGEDSVAGDISMESVNHSTDIIYDLQQKNETLITEVFSLQNKNRILIDFINRISGEMLRNDFVLCEKWYEQAQEILNRIK